MLMMLHITSHKQLCVGLVQQQLLVTLLDFRVVTCGTEMSSDICAELCLVMFPIALIAQCGQFFDIFEKEDA